MMSLEAVTSVAGSPSLLLGRHAQRQQCVQLVTLSEPSRLRKFDKVRLAVASSAAPSSAASVSRNTIQPQQEVELKSELGVSYEALRDKLAAGEWEAADAETRRLLCVLAGEGAVKRKWVYYSEVQFIPEADFKTVDALWRAYSDNKFGYSVQRRIWKNVGESWTLFFQKVGWTRPMADSRNNAYKKFPLEFDWDVADPTPLGHLPLTNALRGTQLLEKVLSHPAFEFADDEEKLLLPDTESVFSQPPQQASQQPSQPGTYKEGRQVLTDEDLAVDYGF
jgi:hypothetical protein